MMMWLLRGAAVILGVNAQEDIFMTWFQDQKAEILDAPVGTNIEGCLPEYVKGSLLRVGPSIATPSPDISYSNFLDAFGRITKWDVDGASNTSAYTSSMIRSLVYNASDLDGAPTIARHIFQEQTDPRTSFGLFDLDWMDNTDVNVYRFSDPLTGEGVGPILTFTDFHLINAVDWNSLRTLGSIQFNDTVTGSQNGDAPPDSTFFSGSHPGEHVDASTGEVVLVNWLGQKLVRGYRVYVYKMGRDMKRVVIGSVDVDTEPYSIHAVAVTSGYVALVVGPVDLEFLRTGVSLCVSCSAEDHIGQPSSSTRLFVFDLEPNLLDTADSGEHSSTGSKGAPRSSEDSNSPPPVAEVEMEGPESFFIFHFINAVLNGTTLTLDTCAYDSMDGVLGDDVLGNLAGLQDPQHRDSMQYNCDAVRRLVVSLEDGGKLLARQDLAVTAVNLTSSALYNVRMELVSVDPRRWGSKACFMYGLTYHAGGSPRYEDTGLVKIDACAAERGDGADSGQQGQPTAIVAHEDGVYFGEPVFVGNPQGTDEDDGTLLVVAKDGNSGDTALLAFDARTMQQVRTT